MAQTLPPAFLPSLLGALFQRSADGELVLEQNDGGRRLFWRYGKLVFLSSDVAGEQFGNYLLRQGVLDLASLKELLADTRDERLGDKVVNWGLLSSDQRNQHLADLYDTILLNALEHPVLHLKWNEGGTATDLAGGVPIALDHRKLVWQALKNLTKTETLPAWISSQPGWKWQAPDGLLSSLGDLPIDPQEAYALSFFGVEPITFDTLLGASSLEPAQGACLVLALWAIGGLSLAEGVIPTPEPRAPEPTPSVRPEIPKPQIITGQVPNLAKTPGAEKAAMAVGQRPAAVPSAPPAPVASRPSPPAAPSARVPDADEDLQIEIMDDPEESADGFTSLPRVSLPGLPPSPASPAKTPSILLQPPAPPPPKVESRLPGKEKPEESELAENDLAGRGRKFFRAAKNFQLQERTGDAIQALEQSVRLDPDSEDAYSAWLLLGNLRMTNPAWSTRAVEALQTAAKLKPAAAEPWAVMGEIYHRKGFRTNARGCFKKALELDPSVPIPADFKMHDEEPEASEKHPVGMLEKLKGLMKR